MAAIFNRNGALIKDEAEASRIHNKGWYGQPQGGGSLKLNLLEMLYLFETERLEVQDKKGNALDFGDLVMQAARQIDDFELMYIVYSDLRRRGLVASLAELEDVDFYLYERGKSPKSSAPAYYVVALSERTIFDLDELFSLSSAAEGTGKEIIIAVVDEEGDITHYRIRGVDPRASASGKEVGVYSGIALADRALIPDQAAAEELRKAAFYGNPLGTGLQISMLEAAFLMSRKRLKLINARTGRNAALNSLIEASCRRDPDFLHKLTVYSDLRERGFIVKTGFKYGSHFRAYDGDPDKEHARYLVHAVGRGFTATWPEISRAVRLAHGVRKELLFGRVGRNGVDYLQIKRHIP
ncbi:MAG: tRNA-intron lyase [Methanomassiliicoccales archaeon]